MKRYLCFATIAAIMLAGCAQDEVVVQNETPESAIGFSTFVDKASRNVETNAGTMGTFKVWGAKTRDVATATKFTTIMPGIDVNRESVGGQVVWTYSPHKYWVKDNAYSFTAIGAAAVNPQAYYDYTLASSIPAGTFLTKYLGVVTLDNQGANGDVDLVWASNKVGTVTSNPGTVKFTFKHLLSRVNLKFVNARSIEGEDYIEVNNVKVSNSTGGKLDLSNVAVGTPAANFKWEPYDDDVDYDFNFNTDPSYPDKATIANSASATTESKYLVPNQGELTVSFSVYTSVVGYSTVSPDSKVEITKIIKLPDPSSDIFRNISLKPGYSYTLVAYLGNDLDNIGAINFALEKVEEYQDAITNTLDIDLGLVASPSSLNLTNGSDGTTDITVSNITIVNPDELVYLGEKPFDPKEYSYEWTLPEDKTINGEYVFAFNTTKAISDARTMTISNATQYSDLAIKLLVRNPDPDTTDYVSDAPVKKYSITLKMLDGDGNVAAQNTITVSVKSYVSYTGGSQDGDDNDG